jgi:hypothetical protein
MHKRNGFDRTRLPERRSHHFRFDHLPPRNFYSNDFPSAAFNDCRESRSEHAIDTYDDGVTRFNDVDDRSLHAGGSSSGDDDRKWISRQEYAAQERLNVVHHV